MTKPPDQPKIYHITHVENLLRIIADDGLVSDRAMIQRGGPGRAIGMSNIKRRRVEELEVPCHADTKVGDFVPFYFCPRSIMLYVIRCADHPELTYRGGQDPIVHLEADLQSVIQWADDHGVRWAFSLSNAGARYTEFRKSVDRLIDLDWSSITANDFSTPTVKEGKQAEFLILDKFPFELVERIGVRTTGIRQNVREALRDGVHEPSVEVRREWYF